MDSSSVLTTDYPDWRVVFAIEKKCWTGMWLDILRALSTTRESDDRHIDGDYPYKIIHDIVSFGLEILY